MKRTRNVLMLAALVTLSIFMSCGGSGGGGPKTTDGEKLIQVLVDGVWSVNTGSTNVNATGTFDESAFSVDFTETSSGVSYSLTGGGLSTYFNGGTFTVSDDADIENTTITVNTSDITASVDNITVNSAQTQVTIQLTVTENSARLVGVGTYTLVFDI